MSCVAILLYLWLTFGGSVPLRAEGYRVTIKFPEATQLAQEADVRISGRQRRQGQDQGRPTARPASTDATLEIDSKYAPLPRDTRAILRQKTLLGETYVELTPGDRSAEKLPDGGDAGAGAGGADGRARRDLPHVRPEDARGVRELPRPAGPRGGRRRRSSSTTRSRNLTPFAEDVDDVLRILRRQSGETRGLVRDTGVVFEALSERQGQLRGLVQNSNRVFETTAARDRELAASFVALPTFLRETRATSKRLTAFAKTADPLVTQLRPAARQLSPTLIDLARVSPNLRGLFKDLGPLVKVSKKGLPALEGVLDDTKPLLARTEVFLRDVQPIVDYLGHYRKEIAAFFALDAAATQATGHPARQLEARALPAHDQPGQPGGPRRLPEAAADEPVEPLRRAGRLQPAPAGPAGVRQVPLRHRRAARARWGRSARSCRARCAT